MDLEKIYGQASLLAVADFNEPDGKSKRHLAGLRAVYRAGLASRSGRSDYMTDLEITKACAEAMGHQRSDDIREQGWYHLRHFAYPNPRYDPLHDDAQAMALVKKFELTIKWSWAHQCGVYGKPQNDDPLPDDCPHTDLNRAICECVAKMRSKARGAGD